MARLRNIKGARDTIKNSSFCIDADETYKGRWHEIFHNNNPIYIEIGMGKGKFLMKMADLYPNINFIGIEMYSSVLVRAIQKAEEKEKDGVFVSNFKFIRMNAEELDKIFEKGEVSRIYLNFSDPWPKERHAGRRLTSDKFLSTYYKIMDDGTMVEFKTDNEALFDFSVECAKNSKWELSYITKDLYSDVNEMKDNVPTEYEEKFTAKGNKICKLTLKK